MQTFFPFKNFIKTLECLDNKRLSKQIVETFQILTKRCPTPKHPAVLMWELYPEALNNYGFLACKEYSKRFMKTHSLEVNFTYNQNTISPFWLEYPILTLSHRVNLLRKDYAHYSKFFNVTEYLDAYPQGYWWPYAIGAKSQADTENWVNFYNK